MKKIWLFLLALAGLPLMLGLCGGLLRLLAELLNSGTFGSAGQIAFILGSVGMVVAYIFVGRQFIITYVFVHELTHAIAGLMCLAKIHDMKVTSSGGYVSLSKSNLFITLAPYCVPLYLLFAVLLHVLFSFNHTVMCAIFGALTFFHILYTAEGIFTVAQPDFQAGGFFFSYWWVISCNLFCAFVAVLYTQDLVPATQWRMLWQTIGQAYQWVWSVKAIFV